MRNLEEARKEARQIIKEDCDLVLGEVEELHNMDEWSKIVTAFDLGVMAGAKSSVIPDEAELTEFLDRLSLKQVVTAFIHLQDRLIENEMEKVKICPTCGSEDLSKPFGQIIFCDKCGTEGYAKVTRYGKAKLYWAKKTDPEN